MALKVTIGDDFAAFVEGLVESGRYSTASEVVGDALFYFEERERADEARLTALRAEIQKGIDSGPGRDVDPREWAEEIKSRGMARSAAAKNGQ